jgi:hypothetical protein
LEIVELVIVETVDALLGDRFVGISLREELDLNELKERDLSVV